MIRVIAGGKHNSWVESAVAEYQKRLQKPYAFTFEFMEEEKLLKKLQSWPFSGRDFVILCDERGQMLSSPEFAHKLQKILTMGKKLTIIIGGAYGFPPEIREKADFLWSFSPLVFPHRLADLICAEQLYRADQILKNSPYHH